MTMPPSLVDRPLMPWPPLRTDIMTPFWSRANARASMTCATLVTGARDRRPAAHVGGPDPGIAEVTRLDGGLRKRGGQAVVVDAGPALSQRGPAAGGADHLSAGGPLPVGRRAQRRHHLRSEHLHDVRIIGHHDQRADAILQDERQQVVHPALRRPLEQAPAGGREAARNVQQPPDLRRVRPAARAASSITWLPALRSPGLR